MTQKQRKKRKTRSKKYKLTLIYNGVKKRSYSDCLFVMRHKFHECLQRNFKDKISTWKVEDGDQISPTEWLGKCVTLKQKWVHWELIDTQDRVSQAAAIIGAIGGRNGKGKAKKRGDSAYYRNLRMLGQLKKEISKLKSIDTIKKSA